jgi:hypothetical protein
MYLHVYGTDDLALSARLSSWAVTLHAYTCIVKHFYFRSPSDWREPNDIQVLDDRAF